MNKSIVIGLNDLKQLYDPDCSNYTYIIQHYDNIINIVNKCSVSITSINQMLHILRKTLHQYQHMMYYTHTHIHIQYHLHQPL